MNLFYICCRAFNKTLAHTLLLVSCPTYTPINCCSAVLDLPMFIAASFDKKFCGKHKSCGHNLSLSCGRHVCILRPARLYLAGITDFPASCKSWLSLSFLRGSRQNPYLLCGKSEKADISCGRLNVHFDRHINPSLARLGVKNWQFSLFSGTAVSSEKQFSQEIE